MTSVRLVFRNVRKNIREYAIYFLTLMLSVSLFYAFNSISTQTAFMDLSMYRAFFVKQLGEFISILSVLIAVILGFLIVYANQFILKRRKKELGIYMTLGMKKGRISWIFAGETLCVGFIALGVGLLLGVVLSQLLSLVSLRLFAVEITKFKFVFSVVAFQKTILCFAAIFVIVMLFNVRSVSSVKLIDLLTASRKNENTGNSSKALSLLLLFVSLGCIITACVLFMQNGILPSHTNKFFYVAGCALVLGTILLFYSISNVFVKLAQSNRNTYLKGLNTFFVRQIGSKIRTNHLVLVVICLLLTVAFGAVSIGTSTALAMNELSKADSPYDLNVMSPVAIDGDSDISAFLLSQGVDIQTYARDMSQISAYQADLTYGELFQGQEVNLWRIDEGLPATEITVVSISDFNRAMTLQGKSAYTLNENEFLLNCNYKGTIEYIEAALEKHQELTVGGVQLQRASEQLLDEAFFMNSIGTNDHGTLIVPEAVAQALPKGMNLLLVQYKSGADSGELLQKLLPIGLDENHSYRYAEKNMMYDMYYGANGSVSFLCCYIGLIFLLICAALLALKQLTETADNIRRYGLLQKLGADTEQINKTLLAQVAVFFAAPLAVACIFSAVLIKKAMQLVENMMNLHITTNVIFSIILFLLVYGSYFISTYLSCKRMVGERKLEV